MTEQNLPELPRSLQPPRGTHIDWNDPLSRGMIHAYVYNETNGKSLFDLITRHVSVLQSGATWSTGKYGAIVQYDGTIDGKSIASEPTLATSVKSAAYAALVWIDSSADLADFDGILGWRNTSDNTNPHALIVRSSGGFRLGYIAQGSEWSYASGPLIPYGQWVWLIASITPASTTLYANTASATNTASVTGMTFDQPLYIGNEPYTAGVRAAKFKCSAVYIWFGRSLTKDDVYRLIAEPYAPVSLYNVNFVGNEGGTPPPPPPPSGETMYLRDAASDIDPGAELEKLLSFSRGTSAVSKVTNTVAGPTAGVQVTNGAGGTVLTWLSPPLDDVTIAGTITFNIRALESAAQANTGMQVKIERTNAAGVVQSTIVNSEHGTELTTSETARNWTASPTSTVITQGERIKVTVYGNDASANMGSGRTFTIFYDGASGGASGDSYITFTETLSEVPTGTDFPRSYSSTVSHTSDSVRIEGALRTDSETVSHTSVTVRLFLGTRTLSATTAHTSATQKGISKTTSSTVAHTSAAARIGAFARAAASTVAHASAAARSGAFARVLSMTTGATSSAARLLAYLRNLSSTTAHTSAATGFASKLRAISATTAHSATVTRLVAYLRSLSMTTAASSVTSRIEGAIRSLSSTVASTSSAEGVVTPGSGDFPRAISSTIANSASIVRVVGFLRTLLQRIPLVNLAVNSTFEANITGIGSFNWVSGGVSHHTSEGHGGSASLRVAGESTAFSTAIGNTSETIAAASGQTWRAEAWVKNNGGRADGFSFGVQQTGGSFAGSSTPVVLTNGWQRVSTEYTTDTGTTAVIWRFTAEASDDYDFLVDDVVLHNLSAPAATTVVQRLLGLVRQIVGDIPLTNILTNGDFETDVAGWTNYLSGTPAHSTTRAANGTGSLHLTQTAGVQFGIQKAVTTLPSTVYRARFWLYTITPQTVGGSLTDGIDQSLVANNTHNHGGGGWEEITLFFNATDSHTSRTLAIYNAVALVPGEEWWVDDVRLYSMDGAHTSSAVAAISAVARALVSTIAHTTTAARLVTYLRSLSSTVAHTTTAARFVAYLRNLSSTISHTSAAVAQLSTVARSITSTIAHTSTVARLLASGRVLASTITHTAALNRSVAYLRTRTSTVTHTSAAARVEGAIRTLSRTTAHTSAAVRATAAGRAIVSTIAHSALLSRLGTFTRTVASTIAHSTGINRVIAIITERNVPPPPAPTVFMSQSEPSAPTVVSHPTAPPSVTVDQSQEAPPPPVIY